MGREITTVQKSCKNLKSKGADIPKKKKTRSEQGVQSKDGLQTKEMKALALSGTGQVGDSYKHRTGREKGWYGNSLLGQKKRGGKAFGQRGNL